MREVEKWYDKVRVVYDANLADKRCYISVYKDPKIALHAATPWRPIQLAQLLPAGKTIVSPIGMTMTNHGEDDAFVVVRSALCGMTAGRYALWRYDEEWERWVLVDIEVSPGPLLDMAAGKYLPYPSGTLLQINDYGYLLPHKMAKPMLEKPDELVVYMLDPYDRVVGISSDLSVFDPYRWRVDQRLLPATYREGHFIKEQATFIITK
ncbi:MAG: hypothetical protein D6746_01525 [Bacteroidetes bacterium]|nr:MAG: hypothetical protein D6746_01525 [Bacteroidota bacterium]